MALELIKDGDKYSRVWVELPIVDAKELTDFDMKLRRLLVFFTPKESSKRHLTVMHLGRPDDLWREIVSSGVDVPQSVFLQMFTELLTDWQRLFPADLQLTLSAVDLALFSSGDSRKAVVARCQVPARLLELRLRLWMGLAALLIRLGVKEPVAFALSTKNLQHEVPSVYAPHVTLGFVPAPGRLPEDSSLDLAFVTKGIVIRGVTQ